MIRVFARSADFSLVKKFESRIMACIGAGVLAQLVERLVRNEKVRGSNPLGSTILKIEKFLKENKGSPNSEITSNFSKCNRATLKPLSFP